MRLRVGAATHAGRVRALNEDAYGFRVEQGLFVVCDGMGGAPAGEVASQMAVDIILRELNHAEVDTLAAVHTDRREYLPHSLRLADAVRQSNQFIYNQAQRHPSQNGMGTTVVAAWIRHNVASIVHVGDSRAYLCHHGRLEPLTDDHSLVNAQVVAGQLDREKSLQSDQQNILLRAVGREPDIEVDVHEVPVRPGDYLLLCSDGLTRMVPEPKLAHLVAQSGDAQRICDCLIDAANNNGGADNITVVVVEVTGSWWQRLSRRWGRHVTGGLDANAHSAV